MADSTPETPTQLVERFVINVNCGDLEGVGQLVSDEIVRHSQSTPGVEVRSREDLLAQLEQDSAIFTDLRIDIDILIGEADRVALLGRWNATQIGQMGPFPPLGRSATVVMSSFFRIDAGKIAEMWVTWDNAALLAQLGHAEPNEP